MRRSRGFTLIELLTAAALFAMLSGMLFQMVKSALDVWRIGEDNRESLEKGSTLIHEIAAEFRMLRTDSPPGDRAVPVRMLVDYGLHDLDLDQRDESLLQRVRFVRSCPEERFDSRIRLAGESADGEGAFSDAGGRDARPTRAPGGLAEVGFATIRIPVKGEDAALLSLVRFFRTPIGGTGSLFAAKAFETPQRMILDGVVLADNVLYLGFEFWSRDTEGWEQAWNTPAGPLTVWDSTRGALLEKDTFNEFLLARGVDSEREPGDDVFPRRLRITLVVEKDDDESQTARLLLGSGASDSTIMLDRPQIVPSETAYPYLKIDGEWLRFTARSDNQFKVERGVRGSARAQHAEGARVHLGRTYQRTVEIPVFREDWNDR